MQITEKGDQDAFYRMHKFMMDTTPTKLSVKDLVDAAEEKK